MDIIRKRRRQGVTNYRKRTTLLKGRLPRVIARRSNRGITMQLARYADDGDKILTSVSSAELRKFGWVPKRNTPTAYLTGMLFASKAKGMVDGECVLDTGLNTPGKASILFAAAKGAIDNGVSIRSSIEFDESRISGVHIAEYASKLAEGGKGHIFSDYAKKGIDPKDMKALFGKARDKIKGMK